MSDPETTFTITDVYFVWSTESVFLGLCLYINCTTVLSSTWVNWSSGLHSYLLTALAWLAVGNSVDTILNAVRSNVSDPATIIGVNIAEDIVEWAVLVTFICVNYTRFRQSTQTGSALPTWVPKALRGILALDIIVASVIYICYMTADSRDAIWPGLDTAYSSFAVYDALANTAITAAFIWHLQLAVSQKRIGVPSTSTVAGSVIATVEETSGHARGSHPVPSSPSTTAISAGGKKGPMQSAINKFVSRLARAPSSEAESTIAKIRGFLALECAILILANVLRISIPDFDPQWSLVFFGESLRLRIFNWFFVILNDFEGSNGSAPSSSQIGGQSSTGGGNSDAGKSSNARAGDVIKSVAA
ncbi:hypothetical protein BC828DRAFT_378949 [Blastocladiella britannica]|nr:hypothetical protein BC828DRAFT_378949 [Blastocladiella britannica]